MWARQREAAEAAEKLRQTVESDELGYLDLGARAGPLPPAGT